MFIVGVITFYFLVKVLNVDNLIFYHLYVKHLKSLWNNGIDKKTGTKWVFIYEMRESHTLKNFTFKNSDGDYLHFSEGEIDILEIEV
jgi:hypothetical protein